jgi:hypothetical protein
MPKQIIMRLEPEKKPVRITTSNSINNHNLGITVGYRITLYKPKIAPLRRNNAKKL